MRSAVFLMIVDSGASDHYISKQDAIEKQGEMKQSNIVKLLPQLDAALLPKKVVSLAKKTAGLKTAFQNAD